LTYFFKRHPRLHGKISVKKNSPDIQAIVYSAICKELADVHDVTLSQLVPTKITSERVKELEKKVIELEARLVAAAGRNEFLKSIMLENATHETWDKYNQHCQGLLAEQRQVVESASKKRKRK
jgi:hypothetical protein